MKKFLRMLGVASLGVACTGVVRAGDQTFNMDTDPAGVPGFLICGPNYANHWQPTDGNPATGGWLQIAPAAGSSGLIFVFPDVDIFTNADGTTVSLPIKAFSIDMDLRVGNGTTQHGADGFSISFCRPTDQVLTDATNNNGTATGSGNFAGGDTAPSKNTPPYSNDVPDGSGDAENGTKTGLVLGFDAWEGNWVPALGVADTWQNSSGNASNDKEGLRVALDEVSLVQYPFYLNGAPDRNGTCADCNSAQTGPWTGGDGSYAGLCWQTLHAELDTNKQVTVIWKGCTILDHFQLTNYPTSRGRLVIAGRTGGNNQNIGVDNIHIVTIPSVQSVFNGVVGLTNGFQVDIASTGPAIATNFTSLTFDGTNVLSSTTIVSNNLVPPTHVYAIYTNGFIALGTHTVAVTWQDRLGNSLTASGTFTTPSFFVLPANLALTLSAVDITKPGFVVHSWQSAQYEPNSTRWAEEQVIGLRGTNLVDLTGADASGNFTWPKAAELPVLNIKNGATAGVFSSNSVTWDTFGIGVNPPPTVGTPQDQSAAEFFSYVYFPTGGVYTLYVGSDDGFDLTASQNPFDRMGTHSSAMEFSGGRGVAGTPQGATHWQLVVPAAGAYPMRLLFENGTGGCNLEWYASYIEADGTTNYILINDDGTQNPLNEPSPIKTYRALSASGSAGAYVKKADPVRDGQNVVFYQPIVVDLGDGTGNRTVTSSSVALTVDGTSTPVTATKSGSTTHVVQTGTPNWFAGAHTVALTFADAAGTNYAYTWPFTVINVTPTNYPVVSVPAGAMVAPNTLDNTQPGFRVRSYQTYAFQPNTSAFAEEQLEGLWGPNLADQTLTNGPGYFTWSSALDFLNTINANGGGNDGEYTYNNNLATFGIGGLAFQPFGSAIYDNSMLEFEGWLVFPQAGAYIMHGNSDDGFKVMIPSGGLSSKLGVVLGRYDGGRGIAGPNNGAQVGDTYFIINIPAAGAYPFRVLWENGGGGAALEWSIYQALADGSIAKVPINDPNQPESIKAFQVTSAATGPAITEAEPADGDQDMAFYAPIVVNIADAGTKTVNTASVALSVDGVPKSALQVTKASGVTHIALPVSNTDPTTWWQPGWHTNILTYQDSGGATYSSTWAFSVFNQTQYGFIEVPATNRVDPSTIDHTRPGFLVHSYQTTAGNNNGGGLQWTEEQFEGLHGANLADQTGATNEFGSFVWNDGALDLGGNTGNGEWGYNLWLYINSTTTYTTYQDYWTGKFGFVLNPGGTDTTDMNNNSLEIGTWLEFSQPGYYIMTVNSDDEFKLQSPNANPFNKIGTVVVRSPGGGRGMAGAAYGPRGGVNFVTVHVPVAGAYPFRLLWENGGGGFGVEWSIYQYLSDGSVQRVLLNETNAPLASAPVKAYQVSTVSGPYVKTVSPIPDGTTPDDAPVMNLGVTGPDLNVQLQDGATTVKSSSVTLTYMGVAQPVTVTQPGGGVTQIVRAANDTANPWPSGGWGALVLSYQDNLGRTYSVAWNVRTAFWGTLSGGYPLGSGDTTKPGALVRIFQVEQQGGHGLPNRIHAGEQVLAGLWSNNVANVYSNLTLPMISSGSLAGYFVAGGNSPSNGVIDFSATGPDGDFRPPAYPETPFPGIPGIGSVGAGGSHHTDSFAAEFLTYVEFPTNGIYMMGVASDDGFRLTRGWSAPNYNGAVYINGPDGLTGWKAAVLSSTDPPYPRSVQGGASLQVTNLITGNLVLAMGTGYGSTNPVEACTVTNGSALAGNVALIYRGTCGFVQKVQNAAKAGAKAVIVVQDRPVASPGDGWFPEEMGVSPLQPIPAVMIPRRDGDALSAALATNANVTATLTPLEYEVNPPASQSPLGEADWGKGASDVIFPVVVSQPGVYPLRLAYWQGGGGASCELFSLPDGATKVLVNDSTSTVPALKAYYGVTVRPTVAMSVSGSTLTINHTGTLQMSGDLMTWVDVYGQPPHVSTTGAGSAEFFRAR